MPVESPCDYIPELDAGSPLGSEPRSQGDDHLRNIKAAILGSFPNFVGVTATPKSVTLTEDEINDCAQKAAATNNFTGDIQRSARSLWPIAGARVTVSGAAITAVTAWVDTIPLQLANWTYNTTGSYTVGHSYGHTNYLAIPIVEALSAGAISARVDLLTNNATRFIFNNSTTGAAVDVNFMIAIVRFA